MLPPACDGTESLKIDVTWKDKHRDRVTVTHSPVGAPSQLVVSGRSANDLMKSIAQFLDYELDLTQEDAFVFRFKKE